MNHKLDIAAAGIGRLVLRPWRTCDAPAASQIYQHLDVTHRLSPSPAGMSHLTAVHVLLAQWIADADHDVAPVGRWAVERGLDRRVIGGASLLPLPPGNDDLAIAWRFHPAVTPDDHVPEVVSALASWAFDHCVDEVFTVVRPDDTRTAAHAGRSGMRWVGETTKYFGLDLQVYRLRPADLVHTALGHEAHVALHRRAS
jgi:RimJ/RimL family protein N-acetyltransferase